MGEISPCSWIGRLNIVEMPILLNLIYRLKAIPIQIPASYFVPKPKTKACQMCSCQSASHQDIKEFNNVFKI